jgi:hypothetical protein
LGRAHYRHYFLLQVRFPFPDFASLMDAFAAYYTEAPAGTRLPPHDHSASMGLSLGLLLRTTAPVAITPLTLAHAYNPTYSHAHTHRGPMLACCSRRRLSYGSKGRCKPIIVFPLPRHQVPYCSKNHSDVQQFGMNIV